MAQFDVHRNTGSTRGSVPYVVVVQSSQFDRYRRRIVVPLVLKKHLPNTAFQSTPRLTPIFTIEGQAVVLHVLDMTSVALDKLGVFVTSLKDVGMTITDALDELLTRTYS